MLFGDSHSDVSMSADKTTVAIGTPTSGGDYRGRVRVYRYDPSATNWTQLGGDIDGAVQSFTGTSVSLVAGTTGTIIAVGSPSYNTNTPGRVRVYRYDPSTNSWVQLGGDIVGAASNDASGRSVSMVADGSTVGLPHPWLPR